MSNESPVLHPVSASSAMPSLADLLAAAPSLQPSAPALTVQPPVQLPVPHLRLHTEPAPLLKAAPSPSDDSASEPQLESDAAATDEAIAKLHESAAHTKPGAKVPLLLVHAGLSEGALIQSWMNNVLKGSQPHLARFQETVADLVQYHQPHAVLIQFDPYCIDAAVALATQLQTHYPHIPRLAIGRTRYAQCMLAALRTGVQDFLDIDSPIETAQQAIQQLVNSPPTAAQTGQRAAQTAIIAARAGLGSSLLAAHLSWHLQMRLAHADAPSDSAPPSGSDETEALSSLLIELGTPGGDCAIYLNTPGEFSFSDAVAQQRRLDRRMALSALARHESGLRLLTQARQSAPAASTEVDALLKRLSQYFRHIVLDLGATESPQLVKDVLPHASEIWVVCDQSVASVVWTTELMKHLDQLNIDRDRLQLIVSRHDPRLELSAEQIARQLQLPLLDVIPERRRELSAAVNQGALLSARTKREPYVQAVERLVNRLLAEHHPDIVLPVQTSANRPASPLARLMQRISRN